MRTSESDLWHFHPNLVSLIEEPGGLLGSHQKRSLRNLLSIPAQELNIPTASFYCIEVIASLKIPLAGIFENIPDDLPFWDLRLSEQAELSLDRDSRAFNNFSQISQETPAWLESIGTVTKKKKIEILAKLLIRDGHEGMLATLNTIPDEVKTLLLPRPGPFNSYFAGGFDEESIVLSPKTPKPEEARPQLAFDVGKALEDQASVHATIMTDRIMEAKPRTLQSIGSQFSLTRERIRQLENQLLEGLHAHIEEGSALKVARDALRQRAKGITTVSQGKSDSPELTVDFGGWSIFDILLKIDPELNAWSDFVFYGDKKKAQKASVALASGRTSSLYQADFESDAEDIGWNGVNLFRLALSMEWVEVARGEVFEGKQGRRERAIEFLRRAGDPQDAETIFGYLPGKSFAAAAGLLANDSAFTRTSKSKFGLSEWGGKGYSSISGAIFEALSVEGHIAIDVLIELLVEKFEVTSASVASVSSQWPFQLKGGVVSEAQDDIIRAAREPSEEKNLWSCGEKLVWAVRVSNDHLRGSGTRLPATIAKELGLSRGQNIELNAGSSTVIELRVSRNCTIGSVRGLINQQNLANGDWCFFIFGGDSFALVKTSHDPILRFQLLMSLFFADVKVQNTEGFASCLKAMLFLPDRLPLASVFSALGSRGDSELVRYLKQIFPNNSAFDVENNHLVGETFIIKSID